MKKKVNEEKINKPKRHYDKGQVFVKVIAGIITVLMVVTTGATLIFSLMG